MYFVFITNWHCFHIYALFPCYIHTSWKTFWLTIRTVDARWRCPGFYQFGKWTFLETKLILVCLFGIVLRSEFSCSGTFSTGSLVLEQITTSSTHIVYYLYRYLPIKILWGVGMFRRELTNPTLIVLYMVVMELYCCLFTEHVLLQLSRKTSSKLLAY